MTLCVYISKMLSTPTRAYWKHGLWFWEKPCCHQTLTRSRRGRGPLCYTLVLLLAIHFSRVVVIASSPKSNIAFIMHWGCTWSIHTCIYRRVYLWVRSMEAKSGKWCHQANWRLIKACWSAPINLSTTFSFQTVCRSHAVPQKTGLCWNPRLQDMSYNLHG